MIQNLYENFSLEMSEIIIFRFEKRLTTQTNISCPQNSLEHFLSLERLPIED